MAGLATGGGRLFGDLVSGETGASSDLTTEAAELLTKKKKKKKNSHKTKGEIVSTAVFDFQLLKKSQINHYQRHLQRRRK